ncbi:hypothetical protein [Fictibacillus fluitans]|uniref:Uncharacterized protein n=1 Tax=Fictibacillus fluitans TaxID=3058422 RepID=A0ABT8I4F0_9BACL|nr:hypothetical protein [Fictibacillus sp. NE201]MDN4527417.1 hypothetical protein [Fictibacillus sp. NE201]
MKSSKAQAARWLSRLIQREQIDTLDQPAEGNVFLFTIEGFCERNPTFFICRKTEGLGIGYHSSAKDPVAVPVERHLIEWHVLESATAQERQERILNTLVATIRARKKQYRTCQYCSGKYAPEQGSGQKTCYSCGAPRSSAAF